MRELRLTRRLEMIYSKAVGCRVAADIGTDHGYLAAKLLMSGADKVYACDINEGPLSRAAQTASDYGIADHMEFRLCDGLAFSEAPDCDTLIIAGMGGETIIGILNEAPWTCSGAVKLILQAQTKYEELCEWLHEHSYVIEDASATEDAGRLYCVLVVRGGEVGDEISYVESALSKSRDPYFRDWLKLREKRLAAALNGMERSLNADKKKTQDTYDRIFAMLKEIDDA